MFVKVRRRIAVKISAHLLLRSSFVQDDLCSEWLVYIVLESSELN